MVFRRGKNEEREKERERDVKTKIEVWLSRVSTGILKRGFQGEHGTIEE